MYDTQTRGNIRNYYADVQMPGGYSFNTPKTLKTIELYYNSQFATGEFDSKGFKKFFYNIVKPACDIATKFIDLDTKDFLLYPELAGQEWQVYLMQQDFRQWLKESDFGQLLNELAHNYPKDGHIVIRKDFSSNKWRRISLLNLRFDPSAPSLEESGFVYELVRLTPRYIMDMVKKGWKKEAVSDLFERYALNEYLVYLCYEYSPDTEKKWKYSIKAGIFDHKDKNGATVRGTEAQINDEMDFLPTITLFEGEIDTLPYRELAWERVPGRLLGQGFVEYLKDNQVAENEAENLERKGLVYTSKRFYQSQDENIAGKNVLTDVEDGDIIFVQQGELKTVQNEERNLAAFDSTRTRWQQNTERKTFSFDVARGGNLPSRTPLGVANLSAGMVASYFDLKRENLGLFLKKLVLEDVIPSFKKERKGEHNLILTQTTSGIEKLIRAYAKMKIDSDAFQFAMGAGGGFFPDEESRQMEEDRIVDDLKAKKFIPFKIADSYYENAKYLLDIEVAGETDVSNKQQTLQLALQLLGSNPAILQDKNTKTVFMRLLELSGISPVELNLLDMEPSISPEMMMEGMPQGGSVAGPGPSPAAQMGKMPTTM